MKYTMCLLITLLCSNSLISATTETKKMFLAVGQKKTIALKANKTTGFSWFISEMPDSEVVSITEKPYALEKKARMLVGAGGTQSWLLEAHDKGTTHFTLEYKRPWEKDVAPAEVREFVITVK